MRLEREPSRAAARRVPRAFYRQDTLHLARALLGLHLVHEEAGLRRVGRIVETEAYLGPQDLAAHSSKGRTARTEVMFGEPGHAYVYLIYGMWYCLNIVAGNAGRPHAVLLRALEPVANLAGSASGPGRLCRALHVDRRLNGADLCGGELWLERPEPRPRRPRTAGARLAEAAGTRTLRVGRSARIGVDYAGDWAARPWRFFDRDSPYVSRARVHRRTPRTAPSAD